MESPSCYLTWTSRTSSALRADVAGRMICTCRNCKKNFISVDHLTVGQVLPWQQTLVYHIADRLSFHILCCSSLGPSRGRLQSVSNSVQCVLPQNWSLTLTQSTLHTRSLEADSTCISLLCPCQTVCRKLLHR